MGTLARFLSLIAAVLAVSGCAHYQLGPGGTVSFRTLYIEPASNRTSLPQVRAALTAQVREAFERDGRISLVNSPKQADATLEIAVTDYRREIAASREDDTGLARKFSLNLGASVTLTDNRTGKVLVANRIVAVKREAFVDNGLGGVPFGISNDQQQAEYNTLPQLADALALKVTHAVLDVW